jgi:LmbE family N-acetylglucosaminyl deacetylase
MVEAAQILVVAAHPDDPEFGVAGSVARWVREGKKVVYVLCTSGDKGTSDRAMQPERLTRIREEEQIAAASTVGVKEVVFLRYPDQGLEDTPQLRKDIVRQIRKYRPYMVVTQSPYRRYIWHRDHRIAGQVTLDAIFPYARDYLAYPDLIAEGLEPHKAKEVLLFAAEDDINYISDITDTFEIKLAALRCHKSQVGAEMSPKLVEMLKQRARDCAKDEPFQLAESFHRVDIWQ